ncbi:MAG: hypothetical protein WC647_09185 [Desulfomonilaceae bacterium]
MRFVIVGFGKFGRIAFDRLKNQAPSATFIIVDPNISIGDFPSDKQTRCIQQSGPEFLLEQDQLLETDVVIPVAPFNVAAAFIVASNLGIRSVEIPNGLCDQFQNPLLVDKSNLCVSHADFLCPDDCEEGETCSVTGRIREPMFQLIERLLVPDFRVLTLRSFQLAPGVGGYTLLGLRSTLDAIRPGKNFLIATSCRCHGIITAIHA